MNDMKFKDVSKTSLKSKRTNEVCNRKISLLLLFLVVVVAVAEAAAAGVVIVRAIMSLYNAQEPENLI